MDEECISGRIYSLTQYKYVQLLEFVADTESIAERTSTSFKWRAECDQKESIKNKAKFHNSDVIKA